MTLNFHFLFSIFVGVFWSIWVLIMELISIIKNGSSYFKSAECMSYPRCVDDKKYGKSCFTEIKTTKGNVESTTLKLHYKLSGENNKETILFLHGFPEFWFSWRYQIVEFNKTHRVIALDMRGYGLSDKPQNIEDYQMIHLVKDVKELLDSLGIQSVTLVAHDWGGVVGWYFDSYYPNMVKKYISLNIPHPLAFRKVIRNRFKQFLKSWYINFFQVPCLPEWVLSRFNYEFIVQAFVSKRMGLKKMKLSEEEILAFRSNMSQKGALKCGINYYRAILRFPATGLVSNKKPGKKNKYILIFGESDGAIEVETAKETQNMITSLDLNLLPGLSHWVQQDDPILINRLIKDFINK